MLIKRFAEIAFVLVLAVLSACGSDDDGRDVDDVEDTPAPTVTATPTVNVVSLDQGWDDQTRQDFWFTTQGSQIIPYAYFLALEQASSTAKFSAPENLAGYRYLPAPVSTLNPDGLPIGFVKHVDAQSQAWIGVTCAACHTSQINYQGTGLLIDGAGTLADFNVMISDLVAALDATLMNNAKFGRFADAVLGAGHTQMQADQLRNNLESVALALAERSALNAPPSPPGFGRLDAFGNIFNEVFVTALGVPTNGKAPNAPVSYPFLWTTGQLDLVQWNGALPNGGLIGPLSRNIGEVLGVFGHLQIIADSLSGYPSTVELVNLADIENWVFDLLSPQWPNQYLPPIDVIKAAAGQQLYDQHCVSCHQVIDNRSTDLDIAVVMVPATQIGTDPTMTVNAATRMAQTGQLQGTLEYFILGDEFGATANGIDILVNAVIGVLINHPIEGLEAAIEEYRNIRNAMMFNPESYKARPLNGIWATAPYLHNGSVPSLAQLPTPPAQRVKQFYLGSREFDPVNVGFVTAQTPGAYLYDTTVAGNSNAGHVCPSMTPAETLELIEYLKTL